MTISLTNLIADIEAKIAAANSSTSTDELLKIIKAARAANTIANTYDSAGVMPVDSANVGNVLMSASNNFLYVLDSAGGSWSSITGSEGGGGAAFTYQGATSGYATGGRDASNVIDKFPFSADAHATDVGDLTGGKFDARSIGSSTNGYTVGGYQPGAGRINTIDKFPFASNANAALYGGNTLAGIQNSGGMASNGISGYQFGGRSPTFPSVGLNGAVKAIQKFNYAVEGNATSVGDLAGYTFANSSHSSSTDGYSSANSYSASPPSTPYQSGIEKISFASDGDATNIGDVLSALLVTNASSQSSSTSGYISGGTTHPTLYPGTSHLNIQKFSFASDGNAVDVADLANESRATQGISSINYGYSVGGSRLPTTPTALGTMISRFAFASDGNMADTTYDLTVSRDDLGNTQV